MFENPVHYNLLKFWISRPIFTGLDVQEYGALSAWAMLEMHGPPVLWFLKIVRRIVLRDAFYMIFETQEEKNSCNKKHMTCSLLLLF